MRNQKGFFDAALRVTVICLIAANTFLTPLHAQTAKKEILQPTPIAGESWLRHLNRSFDETSMGKTGRLGPPRADLLEESVQRSEKLSRKSGNESVILQGADLYRVNCRGCHGADGQGAPPEINSVLSPVRATSTDAVMLRMKAVGAEISRADAANLARQSTAMLLDRLHRGGQDMPSFPHLREQEITALTAYLRQLAGVRGAERDQLAVGETRVLVGEHIVKSTCHICHGAAGPNPTPQQLYDGAIPPLDTLTQRVSEEEFVRKVTGGAPVMMGTLPQALRGRMPVFYYLTEEEATDAYLYLKQYPPYQWATLDVAATASEPDQNGINPSPQFAGVSLIADAGPAKIRSPQASADAKLWILPALVGFFALTLVGVGCGFTVCELKRLSVAEAEAKPAGRRATQRTNVAGQFLGAADDGVGREWVA